MKSTYPVILREVGGVYIVDIPGFEINTYGSTQYDAIEMARDAIGAAGIDKLDKGETLPDPISAKDAKIIGGDDLVSVVDVDFDHYRNELDNKLVRKNLTIPYWMSVKARNMGLNLSHVLREAVEEYLSSAENGEKPSHNSHHST